MKSWPLISWNSVCCQTKSMFCEVRVSPNPSTKKTPPWSIWWMFFFKTLSGHPEFLFHFFIILVCSRQISEFRRGVGGIVLHGQQTRKIRRMKRSSPVNRWVDLGFKICTARPIWLHLFWPRVPRKRRKFLRQFKSHGQKPRRIQFCVTCRGTMSLWLVYDYVILQKNHMMSCKASIWKPSGNTQWKAWKNGFKWCEHGL